MSDNDVVDVEVELAAAPFEVYRYWTESDRYRLWMGRSVRLEAIPGGEYFVEMNDGFAAAGAFLVLEPPRRVEFSWGWAPGAGQAVLTGAQPDNLLPPGSSRVVIELIETQAGTDLHLTHRDLPTRVLRENHLLAWRTYLARLVVVTAGGDPGPEPHA
jgi:uncharacterized protein YndB with AHSA1/START domain